MNQTAERPTPLIVTTDRWTKRDRLRVSRDPSFPFTPTHTGFFRRDSHLAGPIRKVHEARPTKASLHVVVAGCSYGAEADSILALINKEGEGQKIVMRGWDISQRAITAARAGRYSVPLTLKGGSPIVEREIERVLREYGFGYSLAGRDDTAGEGPRHYLVDAAPVRQGHDVAFERCDLVVGVPEKIPADLITANHMLQHLTPERADRVIRNLAGLLSEQGVLSLGDPSPYAYAPMRGEDDNYRGITYGEWLEGSARGLDNEFGLQAVSPVSKGAPMMFARA